MSPFAAHLLCRRIPMAWACAGVRRHAGARARAHLVQRLLCRVEEASSWCMLLKRDAALAIDK